MRENANGGPLLAPGEPSSRSTMDHLTGIASMVRPTDRVTLMQVRLLGPLDVLVSGVARPVSGLRRRAVLAVLGLAAGEVVSTDRLIDVVWDGKPPATCVNTLQSNMSYLRGRLGHREAIVARAPGYLLDCRVRRPMSRRPPG